MSILLYVIWARSLTLQRYFLLSTLCYLGFQEPMTLALEESLDKLLIRFLRHFVV